MGAGSVACSKKNRQEAQVAMAKQSKEAKALRAYFEASGVLTTFLNRCFIASNPANRILCV